MSRPLILTLQIDETAQQFYEELRRRYYPPERNVIGAHLTLFHQLSEEEASMSAIRKAAESTHAFRLSKPALRSIGRGVAVFFESQELLALHTALSTEFQEDLIPQDRQRLRPHIVVQNKVDPATAKHTLMQLGTQQFLEPQALGLTLWRYLDGPWEHVADFSFAESSDLV